jgi:mxaJ protein
MFFAFRIFVFASGLATALFSVSLTEARELRACADPNNLPFSNDRHEGFENKIAELLARELKATLTYTWWAQRRGFIRNTLNSGRCDLVTGMAYGVEALRATRPYYRSGFVFVTRKGGPRIASLNDPVLRSLKIGVQLVGDDGANPPPVHALARRGIIDNVRGYSVYGDYRAASAGASIITAVAESEIDVAIVWGPVAGFFAKSAKVPLDVRPVAPPVDGPRLPMVFDITMGVRRDDTGLREELNALLIRLQPQIDAILADYGVPRLEQRE